MKTAHAVIAVTSIFLATGFSEAKRETLVANCIKHGSDRQFCICSFDLIEKRVGAEFLEIIHLQVTGKSTAYEKALLRMATKKPQLMDRAAATQKEAKRLCSK